MTYLGSIIFITRKKRTINNECVSIGFANPILSTEQRKTATEEVMSECMSINTSPLHSKLHGFICIYCFFAFLFYIGVLNRIRPVLDDLADHTTNDCPLPRYQMVIDPKQFCRTRTNGTNVWIPCEFDVYRRSPSSPRSNNGHVSCTSTLVGED